MGGRRTRPIWNALGLPGRARDGQMLPLVALALVVIIGVCGLVVDGLLLFQQHRQAYTVADGAARAAANELSTAAFRRGTVALDPALATARATEWLAPETVTILLLTSPVTGAFDRVQVTVTRQSPTYFVRIVGVTTWQVRATATHQLQFSP
jgi:Flp pilus assembly protein TadG